MSVKFRSYINVVQKQNLQNFSSAADELKNEAVEWVQEQMLYGYHTPHGKDGHTEIYDTGYLAEKSLQAKATKASQNTFTVEVGSTADYAKYVHDGTYKLGARPFITDALVKNSSKIEEIVSRHAKEGFE